MPSPPGLSALTPMELCAYGEGMPRIPFSEPPQKPTNWWKTVPGQLSIVVLIVGLIVIALGLAGVIGPHSL